MAKIVVNGIVFGMKKINETTYKAEISDSDLMPYTGTDGKFYHNTFADMKMQLGGIVSGFQGALRIVNVPLNNGYYIAVESGVYVNAGNISVNLSHGINLIVKEGNSFTKIIIPINRDDYVRKDEIVNNLNSNIGNVPLSAKQGNVLAGRDITDWVAGTLYKAGKKVFYNGAIWNLRVDTDASNYNIPPGDTNIWEGAISNFSNKDLTLSADRSHNFAGKVMEFLNGIFRIRTLLQIANAVPGSSVVVDLKSPQGNGSVEQTFQTYDGSLEVLQELQPTVTSNKGNVFLTYGNQKFGHVTIVNADFDDDGYVDVKFAIPYGQFASVAITPSIYLATPSSTPDGARTSAVANVCPIPNDPLDPDHMMKTGFRVYFMNADGDPKINSPEFYYIVNGH